MKKKPKGPVYVCKKCGDELFADDEIDYRKMIGITCHEGECDLCKKRESLIPLRDYEYATGRSIIWD